MKILTRCDEKSKNVCELERKEISSCCLEKISVRLDKATVIEYCDYEIFETKSVSQSRVFTERKDINVALTLQSSYMMALSALNEDLPYIINQMASFIVGYISYDLVEDVTLFSQKTAVRIA